MILPVMCNGYCFISPIYVDDLSSVSVPCTTDDKAIAEGWATTTTRKFNMDGKTVVWLCPSCTKRWATERQARIDEIMGLVLNDMTERQYWNLVNELYNLQATKEEKDRFSSLLFPARQ